MVHPSAGDCEILGHSVQHDVDAARQSLGICPQQNVLFGTMTVEEHLLLYASIKEGLGAFRLAWCCATTLTSLDSYQGSSCLTKAASLLTSSSIYTWKTATDKQA